jgi:hypothetical protein
VTRFDWLARYFPGPLVATALLLVLLILLTPVLVPNGPPAAGTIFTEAELIVDRAGGSNLTNFYLRGLGSAVRYAHIDVGVATGFNWTNGFPSPPLNWTRVADQSDLVAYQFSTAANPVAVNVTLLYATPGSHAYYGGVFAFDIGTPVGSSTVMLLSVTTTSGTSLSAGVNAEPLSALPAEILLANLGGSP